MSGHSRDVETRTRTTRSMGVSMAAHAAVMLWLVFHPAAQAADEVLTEIAFVDALPVSAPLALQGVERPAPRVPDAEPVRPEPAEIEQHVVREETEFDRAPRPQRAEVTANRMASRLEALRSGAQAPSAGALNVPVPDLPASSGPATLETPSRAPRAELNRGQTARAPLALNRAVTTATAELAQVARPAVTKPASVPGREDAVRRLAGARLMGPVADRPIRVHVTPAYPEWAKRDAVEGSVTLRFIVRADGSIKENVFVQRTAGFEDFDTSALRALMDWRFDPLPGGVTGEQWGTITFHFRLRDAG